MPITIDVGRRGVRHEHRVLGLDRGQLIGRRLEDCWMAYDDHLRPDRTAAEEQRGRAATYLLADERVHWLDSGYQWAIHVHHACRPADLRLGGDLFGHTVRGPTWKAQVGQHQYIDLAMVGQRTGPDRLHEHQRLEQNSGAVWAH